MVVDVTAASSESNPDNLQGVYDGTAQYDAQGSRSPYPQTEHQDLPRSPEQTLQGKPF